jgi:ATP-dependent Clp protease adapter protein ClpS
MSGISQEADGPRFSVMLFNDDHTPMEFVVWVLKQVFQMDRDEATRIMLATHNQGVASCGIFNRPEAEARVKLMMDLARRHQHPLQCAMEAISPV